MNVLLRGAASGLAGVFAMSEVMGLADQAGVKEAKDPFKEVAEHIEERVGVRDNLPEDAFVVSWITSHFGYGSAIGLLYALADRQFKFSKSYPRAIPAGLAFGLVTWLIGFAGWVPAAGLYPAPDDQSKRRNVAVLGAHLVYGVATAIGYHVLRLAP